MGFVFDPKERRYVEGWNIICYDAEDGIGLTAGEYEDLAADLIMEGMTEEAERCYERGIAMGSSSSMTGMGRLCRRQGRTEEAYRWFLEGAYLKDPEAIEHIAAMYASGEISSGDEDRPYILMELAYDIRKEG